MFLTLLSDLEDSKSDAGRELLKWTIIQYLQLAAAHGSVQRSHAVEVYVFHHGPIVE